MSDSQALLSLSTEAVTTRCRFMLHVRRAQSEYGLYSFGSRDRSKKKYERQDPQRVSPGEGCPILSLSGRDTARNHVELAAGEEQQPAYPHGITVRERVRQVADVGPGLPVDSHAGGTREHRECRIRSYGKREGGGCRSRQPGNRPRQRLLDELHFLRDQRVAAQRADTLHFDALSGMRARGFGRAFSQRR